MHLVRAPSPSARRRKEKESETAGLRARAGKQLHTVEAPGAVWGTCTANNHYTKKKNRALLDSALAAATGGGCKKTKGWSRYFL